MVFRTGQPVNSMTHHALQNCLTRLYNIGFVEPVVSFSIAFLVHRFRAGMKDLEVMMINTISSAFETISTVEQGVELLDIFMHLQVREVIRYQ